jgi:hypothetical protein
MVCRPVVVVVKHGTPSMWPSHTEFGASQCQVFRRSYDAPHTHPRRLTIATPPPSRWRIKFMLIRQFEVLEDDKATQLSAPLGPRKLLFHIHALCDYTRPWTHLLALQRVKLVPSARDNMKDRVFARHR